MGLSIAKSSNCLISSNPEPFALSPCKKIDNTGAKDWAMGEVKKALFQFRGPNHALSSRRLQVGVPPNPCKSHRVKSLSNHSRLKASAYNAPLSIAPRAP